METKWISRDSIEEKNKKVPDFKLSGGEKDVKFCKFIITLGISINKNCPFNMHINNICSKASRYISAL